MINASNFRQCCVIPDSQLNKVVCSHVTWHTYSYCHWLLFKCCNLLWSPCGIGQTIIFSSCGFFLLLSFFFSSLRRPHIGCLPYFDTWCGLSANLECRSETSCKRLAGNTGCKKVAKNRHLSTIVQLCPATSSQLRHVSTIGKNLHPKFALRPHHVWKYGRHPISNRWD